MSLLKLKTLSAPVNGATVEPLILQTNDIDRLTIAADGTVTSASGFTDSSNRLRPLVSGTSKTATGTSVEFPDIPSWAKRLTVMFNGVSTNGTNALQVQLGTSSGYEIASYNATAAVVTGGYAGVVGVVNFTTGFGMENTSQTAAFLVNGHMVLTNISGNIWVASGVIGTSSQGTMFLFSGNKTTALTLDRLRVIGSATGSPSDTFDAGTINIMWE
jgi:hypothetical protein